MPSTWVTPRIWVAGERVGASKMNEISTALGILFPYTAAGDIAYRDPGGAYLTRLAHPLTASVLKNVNSGILSWLTLNQYPGVIHASGTVDKSASFNCNVQTWTSVIPNGSFDLTLTTTCTIYAYAFGSFRMNSWVGRPLFGISINGVDESLEVETDYYDFTSNFSSMRRVTGVTAGTRTIQLRVKMVGPSDDVTILQSRVIAIAVAE